MYSKLKALAKQILPKPFLEKNEFFLRKVISLKYRGTQHQCNICSIKLKRFVDLDGKDLLCPNCGSRSRTRRLYKQLTKHNVLNGNVLHFSPPKILYKQFKQLKMNYYSSDYENEFTADYNFNITSIPKNENFFNTIICYHILEHIENDKEAMSELYRVLQPGGTCFIQTPFTDGETKEDPSITSPKDRKKHFGQEDHVRIYALHELISRLRAAGFKTEIKSYTNDMYNGMNTETIILAKKINL